MKAFNEQCYDLRKEVKEIAEKVWNFRGYFVGTTQPPPANVYEMVDNLMLAFRHLEDAAMRIGKAVQAWDGGESVYPR